MKKLFKIFLFSILFILIGFFFFIFIQIQGSIPRIKGTVSLNGLEAEVRITRDNWGIPHIFTQSEKDLFFACGYVHAQDRMWQMELSRRAGFGRLSEIFGNRTLENDKFMRNIGLKEAVERDFEKLSPRMKELLQSYSDGVNSWINTRKFNWPPEFMLLRCRPQAWEPLDSLVIKEIMALLLCVDYQSEAMRGKLVKKLGAQKALQILEERISQAPSEIEGLSLPEGLVPLPSQGSNNWVLAGSRTESGKPLLANDPHLEISLPPIWYEVHLVSPGLNVIGVSIPGIPLVIIGHNESIAWGMTNSGVDVQDLYLERLNPSRDSYLDGDEWKPLLKKEEMIKVKGQKQPERMEVSWTRRGPLVSPLIVKSQSPISLSWTIYEGGQAMEAFYLLNRAKTWQEFVEALKLFDAPSQNFVYADREGNIGYYLSGRIPLRTELVGLFPFPGWKEEGAWKGFLEEEKKPYLFNPSQGFIVTANNKIVPDDFPYYLSFDWETPFRAGRIRELLLQKEKHNVNSLKIIQNDIFSKKGELFLPYVLQIKAAGGKTEEALKILKGWDLLLSSGKEPALYEAFMRFFPEETFKDDLGEDFQSFNSLFRRKKAGLLRILSDPLSPWFDKKETPEAETREEIIKMSLERAYEWLEKNYGPSDNWDWMKINSFTFRHALGSVPLFKFFNRGPYPMNGDSFTVRVISSSRNGNLAVSYRQIIDLADFKNSVCVLSSGQSGHFKSRFYDDQIPLWIQGEYHPMLFDPKDIEAKSAGTLKLEPLNKRKENSSPEKE
jgi:penicillin amidase